MRNNKEKEIDLMKKKYLSIFCAMTITTSMMTGVNFVSAEEPETQESSGTESTESIPGTEETEIILSDETIMVDGAEISSDSSAAVYSGAELIYYKAGQDALYGEGDEEDGHTEEEADENAVITIAQPGTYRVTGSIAKGQISIDLGEDSREDESAVVNLILD